MTEIVLGGSDANRIMNDQAMEVFEEKTGRTKREDLSNVLPVQMGLATEAFNARWYIDNANLANGVWLDTNTANTFTHLFPKERLVFVRDGQVGIRHPTINYIVGHFDGIVVRIEAGTPDPMNVKKNGDSKIVTISAPELMAMTFPEDKHIPIAIWEAKHTGDIAQWNPPEAVVKRNLWQCLLYMMIAEVTSCEMSVFYGNKKWQIHNIDLSQHEADADLLLHRMDEMYHACLNDRPLSDWVDPIPNVVKLANEKRSYSLKEIAEKNWYSTWREAESVLVDTMAGSKQCIAAEKKLKGLVPDDANKVEGELITITINRANRKTIEVNSDA